MAKRTGDPAMFLESELQELLDAEKQIVRALPKMIKASSDHELENSLREHLEVTRGQVNRLSEVFESLGMSERSRSCKGMQGILEEGDELLNQGLEGDLLNCAIANAARKVEHYEMAAYEGVRSMAQNLGRREAISLLGETLKEEIAADRRLAQIANRLLKVAPSRQDVSFRTTARPAAHRRRARTIARKTVARPAARTVRRTAVRKVAAPTATRRTVRRVARKAAAPVAARRTTRRVARRTTTPVARRTTRRVVVRKATTPVATRRVTVRRVAAPVARKAPRRVTVRRTAAPVARKAPARVTVRKVAAPVARKAPPRVAVRKVAAPVARKAPAPVTVRKAPAPVARKAPAPRAIRETPPPPARPITRTLVTPPPAREAAEKRGTEAKWAGQAAIRLIDHDAIRRWAEARSAKPACVKGTGGPNDVGIIRLDFPGYSGTESLQEISWDDWFKKFEDSGLVLMVQETTAHGERSNFNKLVKRTAAESRPRVRTAG